MLPAMVMKCGYESVDDFKAGAQEKFSLLTTGIIKQPSTRLLLINVSSRNTKLLYMERSLTPARILTPRAPKTASCPLRTRSCCSSTSRVE